MTEVAAAPNAKVYTEQISEKVFKVSCDSCDWMETGASMSAVGRKKNKHLEDHRKAVHGTDAVPTIIDAIEGKEFDYGDGLKSITPADFPVIPVAKIDASIYPTDPPSKADQQYYDGLRRHRDKVAERIEEQAGASDKDREEWLAERAVGVTATEVAKLARGYDAAAYDLIQEKLHGKNFQGNGYTRWGKAREPFLEAVGEERFQIRPESRVFRSRVNPRHLASPDGIGINNDGLVALGEYKTCGKELTLPLLIDKGYWDQAQWQMYVMEAQCVWLIWEWRHGRSEDEYWAEPGGFHLIERDDERIEFLRERANRFLADLDHAREDIFANPEPEPVDKWLEALVKRLAAARVMVAEAEEHLRDYLSESGIIKAQVDGYSISYSFGSARTSFDSAEFRKEYPELWAKFQKTGEAPTRQTLRITAASE